MLINAHLEHITAVSCALIQLEATYAPATLLVQITEHFLKIIIIKGGVRFCDGARTCDSREGYGEAESLLWSLKANVVCELS